MATLEAPGLAASWLNGWLAAIGVTILVPDARLAWSAKATPTASFDHPDLLAAVVDALPSLEDLDRLAIARSHPGVPDEMPRKVSHEQWKARAALARAGDATLAATLTDLVRDREDPIAHSPFDSAVPKGLTLHDRLVRCRQEIDDPARQVNASLAGRGERRQLNGLGFDFTRLLAPTDPVGGNWCDPVIELLAFYGLFFIPTRGDGATLRARGWSGRALKRGSFTWPIWSAHLDAPGIDALLDEHWSGVSTRVTGTYESIPYQPRGAADSTRAFASARVR